MGKTDTNWIQLLRYYTFTVNGKFGVGYSYPGCTFTHIREFSTQEARADWVREHLKDFRAFNCE